MTSEEWIDLISSWENLELITGEIASGRKSLDSLMEVCLYSRHPLSWRATWVADKIHDVRPELVVPYLEKIILQLKKETHPGKKRQFLKLISMHDIREKYHSFLMDYCLICFMRTNEPVSVRVYALQILYNISELQPLFKPELLSLIEHEMELHPSAGVLARGRKLAGALRKQI
jgi:hypothetical protein